MGCGVTQWVVTSVFGEAFIFKVKTQAVLLLLYDIFQRLDFLQNRAFCNGFVVNIIIIIISNDLYLIWLPHEISKKVNS